MEEEYFEEEDFNTRFSGRTVGRILQQVVPYWRMVVMFLGFVVLVTISDSIFTYFGKLLIDDAIVPRDPAALRSILVYFGILSVLTAGVVFGFIYITALLGEKVRYDLRRKLFDHLQNLSFSYFDKTAVGWIMSRVTSDSDRVSDLVTWGMLDSTWGVLNILTSLVFMVLISWKLALIVLCMLPILLFVAYQFRKRILKEFREVRKNNSKITGAINENITGVRVVKSLGREADNLKEFGVITNNMYRASYRAALLSALFLPSVQLIAAMALGTIVWFGGLQASYGGITVGGIQAFVSYVTFIMWPIQDLARVFAEMQHAIASGERIFSLVDAKPEVDDRENAIDPGTIRGEIRFEHVNFWYEDEKPILSDFNLRVKPGETIALVGPTGGGKTTIVNLLCRFYEPKQGSIFIGGHDYTGLSLHAIQSRIGIVLQTPHLFSGTIRENIRYGRLDATDDEVQEAAILAGAHDFITRFEKGYSEEVGEGGNSLSVGQKQLISLARAVLARPEIFVMDEATSSVDTLTEALIQRGMETLMKDRTSFVIAHRLSTIKRANRILVIEDGRIAEIGTHAELLRARGKYYQLYTKQFRHQMAEAFDPFSAGEATPAPAD